MGKVIVHECCCGCSLRTGSLAIGVYHTVEALIGIVVYFVLAFSDDAREQKRNLYIVSAVLCIVELMASICLIHGVLKEKKKFIAPWIATTAVLLITYFVIININLFLIVTAGSSVAFSLSGFVSVVLTVYFLVVVYSYHESFNASSGGGQIITYTVESPQFPSHPMVIVPPQDVYLHNFPQQGYPQNLQPMYLQEYPQQPPPYDAPGTYPTSPSAPFHKGHEQKLQPQLGGPSRVTNDSVL